MSKHSISAKDIKKPAKLSLAGFYNHDIFKETVRSLKFMEQVPKDPIQICQDIRQQRHAIYYSTPSHYK